MYKKFKKVFLVMSILGILFTNNYANEIKEVQLIDDFSAELLGETKNQEAEVPKPPVQQQTQEITEEKNIGEEQIEKSKDKVSEDKNENKPKEEIDYTIESLVEIIGKLRELSPLWKTFKDNKLTNVASFD